MERDTGGRVSKELPKVDYKGIFDAGSILYLILLPDVPKFTIVGASDIYLETTKRRREDIVGKGVFEAYPPNPNDVSGSSEKAFRSAFARVMETKKFDVMPIQQYDIPIPESEGGGFEERFWSPTHTPILDSNGNLVQIAQRVEDVTELVRLKKASGQMEVEVLLRAQEIKEANTKLIQANEKLTAADRLKTDFFSNISHEFRTPLTLILGPVADIISNLDSTHQELKDPLDIVYRNALRLLKLVNNLLDFSKIEAGRAKQYFESTDLSALTTDLASTFRSAVERAGLKYSVDCEALSEPVYVDREMWEKIVLNLISNAFKYTLKGEIKVSLKSESKSAELTVSDTGTGIPASDLGKVFERFHRVQGAQGRTHEGTGIGLALVQELVKFHGGTAHVESTLGKGAAFKIRIPFGSTHLSPERVAKVVRNLETSEGQSKAFVEEASRWADDTSSLSEGKSKVAVGSQVKRIVLADDNADMRDYVAKLLGKQYEVISTTNGKEALEVIRAEGCDLVVSDIMMPVMDGKELLREIRNDKKNQSLPVILLSARAGAEARINEMELGADDYLTKPFSASELLSRVHTQINLSQMRASLMRELEIANRDLEAFSYSVSHDLRSPLRSIVGFSGILLEDHQDSLNEEGKKYLNRIGQVAKRMGGMIDSLLSLSRVSRGKIKSETVDLSQIAHGLKEELSQDSSRKVLFKIQDEMKVVGDPQLLDIVLQNLMNNSWKFTSKKESPEITVGFKEENGEKIYFVRDNGAGFDMKYSDKLFSTFQRLHTAAEFEGTGIGLATVRKIIERHKGRIWAEGSLGQGAAFYFTLGST